MNTEEMAANAVSVYGSDGGMDDFPVLKAFQQYIDAEQAKARKRLVMMAAFFGFLMLTVIAVFVVLLINVSSRNQSLNDRMLEYVMKERDRSAAVVVQPPQDSAALIALTAKLDEMQKRLADSQAAAEKAEAEAKAKIEAALKPPKESAAEEEVKILKALLAAEKEKAAAEKEKQRQAELEAYRRKHYPELYEQPQSQPRQQMQQPQAQQPQQPKPRRKLTNDEIDDILNSTGAVSYFPSEDEEDDELDDDEPIATPTKNNYSIPVEVKGSSSSWNIPLD